MTEQAPERIMAAPTGHFHTPEGDFVSWGDDDAAVEYVRADLAKPRVKPLKWEKHPAGIMASTGQGASYVVDDRQFRPTFIKWPSGNFAPDIGSLFEAKAAAQADYERRVLSALILPGGAGHS